MAEWSNVPDSKSGVPQGTVGSNPTLSAKYPIHGVFFCLNTHIEVRVTLRGSTEPVFSRIIRSHMFMLVLMWGKTNAKNC